MNVQFHLRFLGIIFRVLKLEVSVMDFRFYFFLLYRNCKRLREFEEKEI